MAWLNGKLPVAMQINVLLYDRKFRPTAYGKLGDVNILIYGRTHSKSICTVVWHKTRSCPGRRGL